MEMVYSEVCYVVRDLEATIDRWCKVTGAGPFFTVSSDITRDRTYRGSPATDKFTAALGFLGQTVIEFVQPDNDEPSIYQEVLAARGEGVHHLMPKMRALSPEDYDRERTHYLAQGYQSATAFVVPGIGRNEFFDAMQDFGCFFELLELQPDSHATLGEMCRIHTAWDGVTRPIRDYGELV